MGIKGTVRRAADGHIIHSNVDTDIIVAEEPPLASTRKPDEIYLIIERFSQVSFQGQLLSVTQCAMLVSLPPCLHALSCGLNFRGQVILMT